MSSRTPVSMNTGNATGFPPLPPILSNIIWFNPTTLTNGVGLPPVCMVLAESEYAFILILDPIFSILMNVSKMFGIFTVAVSTVVTPSDICAFIWNCPPLLTCLAPNLEFSIIFPPASVRPINIPPSLPPNSVNV